MQPALNREIFSMNIVSRLSAVLLAFVCAAACSAATPLRLPSVIGDHAMLQAGKPDAIWGWAEPKATVTVVFKASDGTPRQFAAIAGDDGRWSGQLPTAAAGTSGTLDVQTGGEHLTIADVLVGEVWLCSGQSNMSYLVNTKSRSVNESTTPELLATAVAEAVAAQGNLRYFAVHGKYVDAPLDDVEGKWIVANAETVGGCFALSWNFAVALRDKLKVPIGVIDSAIGGTAIEPWTPLPDLETCAVGPANLARYKQRLDNAKPDSKAKFDAAMVEWTQHNPTPELQRQHLSSKPVLEGGNPNFPARLYNGMIHGLEPYTLRGFTWFQGDGNISNANEYSVLFQNLIAAWRRRWGDDTLPFYYVEMQNYGKPQEKPVEQNGLSSIRDAQQGALKLPATDVATAIDVGIDKPNYEAHFPDKKPLGRRLAGLALSHIYGQPGLVNSPALKSFAVEGDKIRLKFEHADGLRLRGAELKGFAIRGAEGDWVWASGRIDGEDILVWNERIPAPMDVRYAWAGNPLVSVENRAGLPLRPFRTDANSEWKVLCDGKSLKDWKVTAFGGEGAVAPENGAIVMQRGAELTGINWAGAELPKTNYEVALDAQRIDGFDFFCGLVFPVGAAHCSFVVGGWGGSVVGLSSVDGKYADDNSTKTIGTFDDKRWYQIRLRVSEKYIQAWIDNKRVVNLNTTGKELAVHPAVSALKPLGVSCYASVAAIRNIRLRQLTQEEAREVPKE